MSDVLIPFAIDKQTKKYVEIGDVPRGRRCGCVCPSCQQGLMARQGKSKTWHFAHDSHAEDKPLHECDLSFNSCCRLYTMQLMFDGQIPSLRTPEMLVFEEYSSFLSSENSECVTQARTLTNLEYKESPRYDAKVEIGGYRFFLFLQYPERLEPDLPKDDKAGLLVIDLEAISHTFYLRKSKPGLLKELILELFEKGTENKRWLYHPNEMAARVRLQHRLNGRDKNLNLWEEGSPDRHHSADSRKSTYRAVDRDPEPEIVLQPLPQKKQRFGSFECLICNVTWNGGEFSHIRCPKCKKHYYSRFMYKEEEQSV